MFFNFSELKLPACPPSLQLTSACDSNGQISVTSQTPVQATLIIRWSNSVVINFRKLHRQLKCKHLRWLEVDAVAFLQQLFCVYPLWSSAHVYSHCRKTPESTEDEQLKMITYSQFVLE